jgi:hypothetical protein
MMSLRGAVAILLVPVLFFILGAPTPVLGAGSLDVADCSYGNVYKFTKAICTATLENKGPAQLALTIESVQSGNTVAPNQLTLAPHARANVVLHVSIGDVTGPLAWTYRINGAGAEPHFVRATGFISSVLDVAHPAIDFGLIDSTHASATQTFPLTSSVDSKLRAVRIISQPSSVHARIGDNAKSLIVDVAADAPWGPLDGIVKIALESELQKEAWVEIKGSIAGDVGPEQNPYWIGEITWQPEIELSVPLIDSNGRDFTIGAVTSDDLTATYDSQPCSPARAGCKNLLIHLSNTKLSGLFRGQFNVTLPDRKKHLKLAIWGVLGERPKPGEAAVPPKITKIPVPMSQNGDLVSVTPPLKVQPDPPGTGPLLKWTIGEQASVHGYQIFRSDLPNGPFQLMEPKVIPKIDNGKGSVAYRWRDTSAVKGRTYWYYIAVLYTSGDRRPLSAPQETVAK